MPSPSEAGDPNAQSVEDSETAIGVFEMAAACGLWLMIWVPGASLWIMGRLMSQSEDSAHGAPFFIILGLPGVALLGVWVFGVLLGLTELVKQWIGQPPGFPVSRPAWIFFHLVFLGGGLMALLAGIGSFLPEELRQGALGKWIEFYGGLLF